MLQLTALTETGPDALRLAEIRRVDGWRLEWCFAPYERAAQVFRNDYQARQARFAARDIASVYKSLAAMKKESEQEGQ